MEAILTPVTQDNRLLLFSTTTLAAVNRIPTEVALRVDLFVKDGEGIGSHILELLLYARCILPVRSEWELDLVWLNTHKK